MKTTFRNIAFTALLTLGAFSAMTYVSCNNDECKDVVCANGGTCNSDNGSCTCPSGYEGSLCADLSASKFLGTNNASASYNFTDQGNGTVLCGSTFTGTFTMSLSSATNTRLIITNLGGFGATTTVYADVSGSTLNIPTQNVNGATGLSISGSGTITANVITGSYTSNDGTGNCTYNFTWTKQ